MSLEYIKNHVELASLRLVQQDKESYNFVKLLSTLTKKLQEIEDALFYLFGRTGIFTASGKTLDMIGEIVGEARRYRSDEDYRTAIVIRIAANNSRGTPEEIIVLVSFFVNINNIRLIETNYTTFFIEVRTDLSIEEIGILKEIILVARPVGIRFGIIIIRLDQVDTFNTTYSETYDYVVDDKLINMLQVNASEDTLAVTLRESTYINYDLYYNKQFPEVSTRANVPPAESTEEDIYYITDTKELAIKIGVAWRYVLILWSNP